MAERNLAILVTARNLSGRVLGGVKGDINGIEGAARRASSNVGRNIGLATAAVGAGIAIQVRAGVDSLVELERVENLTEAALKSTGNAAKQSADGIRARAEELEHLTGVDDKVVQNAQNLLLTFANVGKDAFDPTLKSAINLNAALGGGDESLQGVLLQVAKAVNDPVKGMTALRRSGVSFTEAQIKQVRELVKANDLMGAQAIILGELETQFGGAAEAANQGATRAQRRWVDGVEDIQKSLATGFMPLIDRVSNKMSELVADPEFLARVEGFGEAIASGFDEAIDFAESVDWGAVGSALQTMGSGARMAMDAFLSAPPWLQTAILTGWGLNKLTGGALGSIVGELGKGLIKGVLNMNAGVVNVKGAVVNTGPGGGSPTGPGKGKLPWLGVGGALAVPLMLGGSDNPEADPVAARQAELTRQWEAGLLTDEQYQLLFKLAYDGVEVHQPKTPAQAFVDRGMTHGKRPWERREPDGMTHGKLKLAVKEGVAELPDTSMMSTALDGVQRSVELLPPIMRSQASRAESSERAMLGQAITQAQRLAAIQGIEGGNAGRLDSIARKKTAVNVNVPLTVNVSATVVQQQLATLRASVGGGGFI